MDNTELNFIVLLTLLDERKVHSQHIHALISLRGLDSDGGSASYLPVAMVNRSIRAPLMMAVFILTFD